MSVSTVKSSLPARNDNRVRLRLSPLGGGSAAGGGEGSAMSRLPFLNNPSFARSVRFARTRATFSPGGRLELRYARNDKSVQFGCIRIKIVVVLKILGV